MNKNKIQLNNYMDFNSDAIITIGSRITTDDLDVEKYIAKMQNNTETDFIYMHPIDDISLQNKYSEYIKYEAGSEEGVLALLAFFLIKDAPEEIQDYLDDLDIGYLSGESSVGEEELEDLVAKLKDKKEILLLIGDDITHHKYFENITKFIRIIDLYTDINVVLLNENTNINLSLKAIPDDVDNITPYNGTVIYTVNTNEDILKGSASFAMAAKIKDGDNVIIKYEGISSHKKFQVDSSVRGTIALYPILNIEKEQKMLSTYRFKQVKIQRVES